MSTPEKNSANFGSAVLHSFIGRYFSIILQLISTVILARLIAPEEYGLYTIAFVFVATATIIKEFGVNNFLIKEKVLTPEIISSAYGTLILLSSTAAIALCFLATPIAKFYDQEQLRSILQLLSLNVFLSPFGTIIVTLLRRELLFKPDLITGVLSQTISYASTILLAYKGLGVYALVYGAIIQSISQTIILQFFRPANMPYLPGFSKCKEILSYSKFVGVSSMMNHFGNYTTELIAGKYYSLEITGQYNRAATTGDLFNRLFTEGLNPVVMPYVSQLSRQGSDFLQKVQLLTTLTLSLAWPFYIGLALCAEPVILLLFGEDWLVASYFLKLLCIHRMLSSTVQLLEPMLMGLGLAKSVMLIVLSTNVTRIIVSIAMIPLGIMPMLIANILILPTIQFSLFMWIMAKHNFFDLSTFLTWLKDPAILVIFSCAPMLLLNVWFGDKWWQNFAISIPAIILSLIVWLSFLIHQKNAKPVTDMLVSRLKQFRAKL
ncbi:oligosaccharide flippase family protein [Paraglaciecola chathamensis]|uniref:oligosaccharide flippase family protein n=1 Tax=Paraglaciecola chathamensis TaxID=368405 RepID=UPI00270D46E8|nr:oligosaccharide flippase family protein [Paraglaciecola chathamensis]MDO6838891.1 oligosaccharide flippase family protein [Paraglaciecola chathamensis]